MSAFHFGASPITPFPTERPKPPAGGNGLLARETWDRLFIAAHVTDQFRAFDPTAADEAMAPLFDEGRGAASVARMLAESAAAIAALRGILASLCEADRRMAAAAASVCDRHLTARGHA